MGARYYDPLIGRFISPDPYGHAGSIDLYSYANGNPIGYCDPDGRYMSSILEKTRDVYNKYEGDIVKVLDHAQTALDVAGMVPAYGAVPDLINAGIHGLRGNWLGVGTSAVAAVPIVGDFIAAGKMGVKTGQAVVKSVDNIVTGVKAYDVGPYSQLARLSKKSDNLDIHHVGQAHAMEQLIPGYIRKNAPSIVLENSVHRAIPVMKGPYTKTVRDLLGHDISNLKKYTDTPNQSLQQLIQLNKDMYPSYFKK